MGELAKVPHYPETRASPGGFLHRRIRPGRHAHEPGSSSASCCCNGSLQRERGLNRNTCVSDTWKCGSLIFIFTHPPEDEKTKNKKKKQLQQLQRRTRIYIRVYILRSTSYVLQRTRARNGTRRGEKFVFFLSFGEIYVVVFFYGSWGKFFILLLHSFLEKYKLTVS